MTYPHGRRFGGSLNPLTQRTYAQHGQDRLAILFFAVIRPASRVFVDVGAFDGIGFSNTRALFERGWTGICVEPVSKNFEKLELLYRGTPVRTVRAAASDADGEAEMMVATIPGHEYWGSDVSSLEPSTCSSWSEYAWTTEVVPTRRLDSILEAERIKQVDFLSVDVEGHERAVLDGLDLDRYRPKVIAIEAGTPELRQLVLDRTSAHGYRLWRERGADLVLVRTGPIAHFVLRVLGRLTRSWLEPSAG
jgi:FkbM family methyltransferase